MISEQCNSCISRQVHGVVCAQPHLLGEAGRVKWPCAATSPGGLIGAQVPLL